MPQPGKISGWVKKENRLSRQADMVKPSILPNGNNQDSESRKYILETNKALHNTSLTEKAEFVDALDAFLNASDTWKRGLSVEDTQLSMKGYDVLMNQLA